MKQRYHPFSERGIALTEYLVILALVAIGAIALMTAYGRSQRVAVGKTVEAMAGKETSHVVVESSPPQELNLANFTDSPSEQKPKPPGTLLEHINSTIRSVLPDEYAKRFRGLDNPDWDRGNKQMLSDASMLADIAPIVGTAKAVFEVGTGEDPLTGEEKSRLAAAVGVALSLIPGGKAASTSVEIVQVTKTVGREGLEAAVKTAPEFSQVLGMTAKQIQSKFKHAADFGVVGTYNLANASKFSAAINQHINSPVVKIIQGTYHNIPATHYVDPTTGLNVLADSAGNFISGWKLSAQQLEHVLTTGKLGGG
jgi:hypothetical protein